MKKLYLLISVLSSLYLSTACKNKSTTAENRFENYIPITDKEDTIKVLYVQWATMDRPDFIKQSDFLKFNNREDSTSSDSLLSYCFFS